MTPKQISEELKTLSGLKEAIITFEEIAALKMRSARKMILANREYYSGVSRVFQQVEFSYRKEVEKQRLIRSSLKNGRTARVLVSANTGFYGSLIERTFHLFSQESQTEFSHPVIVGRFGRNLAEQRKMPVYAYFDFPDQNIDSLALRRMIDFFLPYSRVVIYHGLFKNILSQEPVASDVSGHAPLSGGKDEEVVKSYWLFEPDLPDILSFFETEIFASLFAHSLQEAMLAKFASRMASLDQAAMNVKSAEKGAWRHKMRLEHEVRNKRQQAALSSWQLWRVNR